MGTLTDIGRSRAGSDLSNFIVRERQRKVSNLREQERTGAYVDSAQSRTDLNENILRQRIQQQAEDNKPIAVKVLKNRFQIPGVADYAEQLARGYGYINEDGTIKTKHAKEIHGLLNQPMHMARISTMWMQHAEKEYDKFYRASQDPEAAKKLKLKPEEIAAGLQKWEAEYNTAAGANKGFMESMTTRAQIRDKQIQRDQKERQLDLKEREVKVKESGSGKKGEVWVLPNYDAVRSFDGGRTYIGNDGKQYVMPTEGAFKVSTQYSGAEIAALKEARKGAQETAGSPPSTKGMGAKEAAQLGTGPYANIGAAIDAFFGGFGIDALLGKQGFFKDKQQGRQKLRLIKQIGKSALLNSSRAPVWEQKKIDQLFPNPSTFFTNPASEARKLEGLRETMLIEKSFNTEAITGSADPKEIARLKVSNKAIDRLLAHIGTGVSEETISDEDLIQKYLK